MRFTALLASAVLVCICTGSRNLTELSNDVVEKRRPVAAKNASTKVIADSSPILSRAADAAPEDGGPSFAPDSETEVSLDAAQTSKDDSSTPESSFVLASLVEEAKSAPKKDVAFQRSAELPRDPASPAPLSQPSFSGRSARDDFMLEGSLYTDWFRSAYEDGLSTSQLSTRLKLKAGKRPGYGWRFLLDARHRYRGGPSTKNKLLLYDARLIYDRAENRFSLSLGQMNLYDSAGVGQLAGGLMGVRVNNSWTVGGYGGLEPDIYSATYDLAYTKFGVFSQYQGTGAKTVALSYNAVRFGSRTEREFLYASGLVPIRDLAVVYASAEYELGDGVPMSDRLSHLFLNGRYSISRTADVTGYFSSGRGLDYHQFLLEQSQTPDRNAAELERFYYSASYGARLRFEVHEGVRLFIAQRESEQKDENITNHTTELGASAANVGGTGFTLYGSYDLNRGDLSESDAYRLSASRAFGRVLWTGYFSSTFNGVRFDAVTGRPEIVRLADHRTFSNDFFFDLTDSLSLSLEHDLSRRGEEDEMTLFFRLMLRF